MIWNAILSRKILFRSSGGVRTKIVFRQYSFMIKEFR